LNSPQQRQQQPELCLINAEKLPPENKDHQLKGTLKDCRECHIERDWLLIFLLTPESNFGIHELLH